MNASRIRLDQQGLVVRARFRAVNTSSETWKPEDGYAVGYQILDPDTGTLVVDGPRTPLTRPIFSTYRSKRHFRSGIVSQSLSAHKPAGA